MFVNPLGFLLSFLIFPGMLFSFGVALLYVGIDRKVSARMQNRIGPPVWQEFLDVFKLLGKEDITPRPAQSLLFSIAPLLAVGAVITVMMLLPVYSSQPAFTMVADLIVILYLLNIPAICMMLGGYSSGSPFGSVGAARHIIQLFGYELVFILSVLTVAEEVGALRVEEIVSYQAGRGWLLFNWRLLPAALATIIAAQGKLLRIPFDIPEAETEIVHGSLTEYSGPKLALFRVAYDVETLAVAALFSALFLGGPASWSVGWLRVPAIVDFLIKTLAVVLVTTLIRNIAARLRIDQALKFYWTFILLLALLSLGLVMLG